MLLLLLKLVVLVTVIPVYDDDVEATAFHHCRRHNPFPIFLPVMRMTQDDVKTNGY